MKKYTIIFISLYFSTFAQAGTVTIAENCVVQNIFSVSPLGEDLNFTRGSGRGSDVVVSRLDAERAARLGNLHFESIKGDRIDGHSNDARDREYFISRPDRQIRFHLFISGKTLSTGYGSGIPAPQRTARLSYWSEVEQRETKIATLLCQ